MGAHRNIPRGRKASARAAGILFLLFLILPKAPIPSSLGQSAVPEPDGQAPQTDAPALPSGAGYMNSALPGGSIDPGEPAASADPGSETSPAAAGANVTPPAMASDACNYCPPLPASPAEPADAGMATAAPSAATASAEAAAGAAAEILLRSPGLTALPANRRMPPAPPPSATAVADQQNWKAIDAKGIKVLALGESHFDPGMLQRQRNFLQSAYAHGVRTLVIEYPKSEQKRLDRYLNDPTYAHMADALSVMSPEIAGLKPEDRAQQVGRLAQALAAVDRNPRQAEQAYEWDDADLALVQANIQMARNWRFAQGKGFSVEGGDVDWNVGLDKGTGTLVSRNPTPQQVLNYLTSARGMKYRNESIAQTAATSAARGRVIVIVGGAHTGFLSKEHLLGAPPNETYPGINYLLETQYHLPSVALAQTRISPQGYLAQSVVPGFRAAHMDPEQTNQRMAADIAQDPFRAPINPNQPIEQSLPDAVARREKALPQLR